ncbi:hypothetical protein JTE90_016995 [Oedothorax gibbosus]|uniref:Uncharacterized protein n=1 Tax=Oedothorax gibbosus TaxID=931172 RepID=A0AAV6UMC6_9ARAC|nr:hypothetical protein JTE90_016995 [Oedothorax gibbosus]
MKNLCLVIVVVFCYTSSGFFGSSFELKCEYNQFLNGLNSTEKFFHGEVKTICGPTLRQNVCLNDTELEDANIGEYTKFRETYVWQQATCLKKNGRNLIMHSVSVDVDDYGYPEFLSAKCCQVDPTFREFSLFERESLFKENKNVNCELHAAMRSIRWRFHGDSYVVALDCSDERLYDN